MTKNIRPLKLKRASLLRSRGQLAKVIAHFLARQAVFMSDQIIRARLKFRKDALTADQEEQVRMILGELDFSGWAILTGDVKPLMEEIAKDGSYAALAGINFDVDATPGIDGVVNGYAQDYADERSAELVGMRRLSNGRLIENPDAEWRIDDATREFVRADVSQAIAEGWSNDKLATELAGSYAFSPERAMLIARTETNMAANAGALAGYKASGVVDKKAWLTAGDDLVDEEECAPNEDAGAIDLDDDFPSGDDAPPAHPNCRCVLTPVIESSEEETSA